MPEYYSTEFIARLFTVTDRRIQQLTQQKILPQVARGKYDIIPTIQAYIRYLNERIKTGDEADLQKEKALLTKAQREMAEIDLAEKRGEIHKGEDVMNVWNQNITNCRSRLLSLPSKCAPQLTNQQNAQEIQEILKGAVYEALEELAEYNARRISGVEVMEEL